MPGTCAVTCEMSSASCLLFAIVASRRSDAPCILAMPGCFAAYDPAAAPFAISCANDADPVPSTAFAAPAPIPACGFAKVLYGLVASTESVQLRRQAVRHVAATATERAREGSVGRGLRLLRCPVDARLVGRAAREGVRLGVRVAADRTGRSLALRLRP
jgi:hypothetical protein